MDALFEALRVAQRRPRLIAGVTAAVALVTLVGWGGGRVFTPAEVPQIEVIFAARDLSEGATLTHDMLELRKMPASYVTASMVRPEAVNYILGHELLVPLAAGDLMFWYQFASDKTKK